MPYPLPCVIFAGGKSSRMGRDKALLPFGGCDTLAEYQYRRLLPLFSSVYLSAKSDKFPFDAPLILDDPEAGSFAPTAGLLAAFEKIGGDFFVLSVDAPFVGEEVFAKLYRAYREGSATAYVPRSPSGPQPMCALYTRALEPALREAARRRDHRLTRLLEAEGALFLPFGSDTPFFNLNRPAEYEEALRRTAAG